MLLLLRFSITIYIIRTTASLLKSNKHFPNATHVETVASCTNLTAKRLFNPERRLVVVYNDSSVLGDAITRSLMKDDVILITNRPTYVKQERILSYIVIEDNHFFNSREWLLINDSMRYLQYLFVTESDREEVDLFARDLWNTGFRDFAFLVFKEYKGTILWPNKTGKVIGLTSLAYCTLFRNNVNRVSSFSSNLQRFCPENGCALKFGGITDVTVNFWRKEDKLRLKRNMTFATLGGMLITSFGNYYNVSIDESIGRNVNWTQGSKSLIDGDVDIVTALMPGNLSVLNGLEIVCWYMYRELVFARRVEFQTLGNDILKMLMPFHYLVWLSVMILLVLYLILVHVLRRLSSRGLIKERLEFMQIWAIMVTQSVTTPKNFGLRLVLLLWMIFSFYLSVTYNSTFTSSLARVETEVLLKDLQELHDSGQPFGGPVIGRSYLKHSTDRRIKEMYKRYKILEPEIAIDSVFSGTGVAVLQQFTVDRLNWNYRRNRTLRIYTLSNPVLKLPVFFFTRKGYFYRNPLRKLMARYRETGLMEKWSKWTFLIDKGKQVTVSQTSDEILTMKHLQVIFHLFFICQGISCLTLLVELLYDHILKRR